MAKTITAYKDKAGKIHETKAAAEQADLIAEITNRYSELFSGGEYSGSMIARIILIAVVAHVRSQQKHGRTGGSRDWS